MHTIIRLLYARNGLRFELRDFTAVRFNSIILFLDTKLAETKSQRRQ